MTWRKERKRAKNKARDGRKAKEKGEENVKKRKERGKWCSSGSRRKRHNE